MLTLIEIKASTLTTQSKYGFDPATLRKELLQKALEGEGGKRKGIAQLRNTITRFQNGEPIADIPRDAIGTVYPVVVFVDRSFVSPYLPKLYQEHFDRKCFKNRPKIVAPYAISLGEFEDVLPFTHKHSLADMFDSYFSYTRHRDGVFAFPRFARPEIPLLHKTVRSVDLVEERFARFNDDLIRSTFSTRRAGRDQTES